MPVAVVKGRDIEIKLPNEIQLMMFQRLFNRVQSESLDVMERMNSVGRILDVVESLIVSPADRGWVVDLMIDGNLDLADLTPLLNAIVEGMKEKNAEAPVKAPVRRGRPKRS